MFFSKEDILSELNCLKCDKLLSDARILPCFQSICAKCIEALKINATEISCVCGDVHKIPHSGFPKNNLAINIINKKARNLHPSENANKIQDLVAHYSSKLCEVENKIKNYANIITDHCDGVRNKIDIQAETILNQLNEINNVRIKYIEQVNQQEKIYFENVAVEKFSELDKQVQNLKCYLDKVRDFLGENFEDAEASDKLNEVEQLRPQIYKLFKKFNETCFGENLLVFDGNPHFRLPNFGRLVNRKQFKFEGKCISTFVGHIASIVSLALMAENKIASLSFDKLVVWEFESQKIQQSWSFSGLHPTCICTFDGNNKIAVGFCEKQIKVVEYNTNNTTFLEGHTDRITCLVSINSETFASADRDKNIIIWEAHDTSYTIKHKILCREAVSSLLVLDNGNLVSSLDYGELRIWDPKSGQLIKELDVMCNDSVIYNSTWDNVRRLFLLQNGNLAVGYVDGIIRIWDIFAFKVVKVLNAHTCRVTNFAQFDNGVFISTDVKSIRFWNTDSWELIKTMPKSIVTVEGSKQQKYEFRWITPQVDLQYPILIVNNKLLISRQSGSLDIFE